MTRWLLNKLIILMALLLSLASHAATLTATVSKNSVSKNEVFQLRVVLDEKAESDDIDFNVLEPDFYLSRPNFGSSINIINGVRSNSSEWNISLAALRLGTLTIPSFEVNGIKSQPIKINVALNNTVPSAAELVEFQSQLTTRTLYPQQSARLASRLIIKGDPRRLQNPNITPPTAQGLILERVGEPKQYQSVMDGIEVTVVDQDYRINAQESGTFTLNAPSFSGTFLHGDRRTGTTQIIDAATPGKTYQIEVKPIPESYTGLWLPAEDLTLSQRWQSSDGKDLNENQLNEIQLGDSLTRTLTLTIHGLTQTQFPVLDFPVPSSVRSYPEKPQYVNNQDGSVTMTIKQVVLVGAEGPITIQGLALNWWNARLERQETNTLAELRLNVLPAAALAPISLTTSPKPDVVVDSGIWPYLTALFAVLWLLTLIMWLTRRNNKPIATDNGPTKETQNIENAVKNRDIVRLQYQVDQWLKQNSDLSSQDVQAVRSAMEAITSAQFNQNKTEWNGEKLLKLIKSAERGTQHSGKGVTLAKL